MTIITLYRTARQDGGTDIGPRKPEPGTPYTTLARLVADEGKLLSKGDIVAGCIDTEDASGWSEIDDPDYIPPEDPAEEADAWNI